MLGNKEVGKEAGLWGTMMSSILKVFSGSIMARILDLDLDDLDLSPATATYYPSDFLQVLAVWASVFLICKMGDLD